MAHTVHSIDEILQDLMTREGFSAEKWAALATLLDLLSTPLRLSYKTYSADGVADMTKTLHIVGSGVDLTGFTPVAIGQLAFVWCTDSTTDATITTGSGVTFDGTNNKATMEDTGAFLFFIALSTTRWLLFASTGTSFSAV